MVNLNRLPLVKEMAQPRLHLTGLSARFPTAPRTFSGFALNPPRGDLT